MLAARFAAEFNMPFQSPERFAEQRDRVRAACATIGRDPESLVYSTAQVVCIGRTDAEIARRAAAIGRDVDELKQNGLCGTPDEALQKIADWGSLGVSRLYLQFLDLSDLEQIELIGSEIIPHL
jgi:alkanesulfonate monooxygenase SsuD/methylene tetrahydromethanopterin reductase-like flavin-dependent oxidoreductase (luciferase family)